MGHGAHSVFTKTVSSGATSTGSYDLGRTWENVYLEIPTMTSNTAIAIQGSSDNSTYRRVKHPALNSSTVSINDFLIASSATNCLVPIPNAFRYIKVEATATVDNGCTFKVICSD